MLPSFILLITANYAYAVIPRTVTVSIVFGEDKADCRGTETFDGQTGLGSLVIKSTDQSSWIGYFNGAMRKVKSALDTLENHIIAKNYCLKKNPISNVQISMVTEDKRLVSYITSYQPDKVTLQILPGVQGNGNNLDGKDDWSVTIPFRTEQDTVHITKVEQNLSILGNWNRTFACIKIYVENLEHYPSLQVGKSELLTDFMTLENSTLPIFLENEPLHDEEEKEVQEQKNIVLPITFGEIVDLEDVYYVEYSLDDGAYVVVRVTTSDLEYPVRCICGFTNKKEDQLMFFPTALTQTATANDPTNLLVFKNRVSWAFDGATKLEVAVEPPFGSDDWNYVEIVPAGLSDSILANDNDTSSRILKVLPRSPVKVPAAPAPSLIKSAAASLFGYTCRGMRSLMPSRTTTEPGVAV